MLIIYGASDDLIELEGDIVEEFECYKQIPYLALSNGVLLEARYNDDGLWKFTLLSNPNKAAVFIKAKLIEDKEGHSDIVTINDDVQWVIMGFELRTK